MDCNLLQEQMEASDLNSNLACSLPDGLDDDYRFCPDTDTPIRRTNSSDDISRFYRYFHLLQTNKSRTFTWEHYLNILLEQLSSFETLTILDKTMLTFISNISIDQTGYFTPETGYSSRESTSSTTIPKKLMFDDIDYTSSAEERSSVVSGSSTAAVRKSRMLKKICLEMRSLAQNISKFVDVIGHLPENCSECGVPIDIRNYKKQCQHIVEGVGDTVDCPQRHEMKEKKKKKSPSFLSMSISSVFSVRSPKGEGELASKLKAGKSNTPKKGSLKHFASLCSKYVKRA